MSTGIEKGEALYDARHGRSAPKPLTAAEVKSSGIAAGIARWQAMHATAPVTGPDGQIVQRPDHAARAAAKALLSTEDQDEVDNLTGRNTYDA